MTRRNRNVNKLQNNELTVSTETVASETVASESVASVSESNAPVSGEVSKVISMETEKPQPKKEHTTMVLTEKLTKGVAKTNYLSLYSELVSLSTFLRRANEPEIRNNQYTKDLLLVYNLSLDFEFNFAYFDNNCPKMQIGERSVFAKWVNVTEKTPESLVSENNRVIFVGKGEKRHLVVQTLKPYNTGKASFEVYVNMFADVANELHRLSVERAYQLAMELKQKKEAEKLSKELDTYEKLIAARKELDEKLAKYNKPVESVPEMDANANVGANI